MESIKKIAIIVCCILALLYFTGRHDDGSDNATNNQTSQTVNPTSQTVNPTYINPNVNVPNYQNNNTNINNNPIQQQKICPSCHGNGECFVCRGIGINPCGYDGKLLTCNECNGRNTSDVDDYGNYLGDGKCATCHGTGYIK